MKKLTLIATSALLITLIACKKEEITTYDCTGETPTYAGEVKALMDTQCAYSGCHDASTSKKGIDLSTYESTRDNAKDDSFLGSIQHKKGYHKMPKGDNKLNDTDIKTISCWVQNGMPE